MVNLVTLWIVSSLNQRLRVNESRLDSLEREQQQVDEELAVLSHMGQAAEAPAPLAASLGPASEPPAQLEAGTAAPTA